MKEKLKQLCEEINNRYKKKSGSDREVIFIAGDHPERIKSSYISTGHDEWDKPLKGGIPRNGVTVVHGSTWSGKTSLCLGVAATLTRAGKYVLYVNLEAVPLYAYQHIGFDLNYLVEIGPCDTAEHLIDTVEELIYDRNSRKSTGVFDLVIIDSINNLFTSAQEKAWNEGPEKEAKMASRAALLNDFLTRLYGKALMVNNTNEDSTAIMLIAHDRANIAGASLPMAPKTAMSGGESLKFNSKVTLKMSRKIYADKTGCDVTMVVEKNTTTGLLGDGTISIIYGKGKDDTQSLIEKAEEFGYLITGDVKGTKILILPGLGDLVLSPIKANKATGTKGVTIGTIVTNTIKQNPEIAQCLRNIFSVKKPPIGVRTNIEYTLNDPNSNMEGTEE